MADPIQTGKQYIASPAPTFADYTVVDGTWKPKDSLVVSVTKDGNSETANYTGADEGEDIDCDVVIHATKDPLAKLDVLVSTETVTRKFVVVDESRADFGGKVLKQTLKLEFRASLQSTLGS